MTDITHDGPAADRAAADAYARADGTVTLFTVCHGCTCALHNADWTAIDYHYNGAEAVAEYDRRMATVDTMGHITEVGRLNAGTVGDGPANPGYFSCYVCDADEIGGYLWEGETR